jgi:hypothetical protein
MSRFIKIPSFFYEDNLLYFNDLWINPFQVESYIETDISYTDDSGIPVERNGVKVFTKGGMEWGVLLTIEEFERIIE